MEMRLIGGKKRKKGYWFLVSNSESLSVQSVKMTVQKLLKDFADGTSIHGLCFMVEHQASIGKRVTWFLLFLASVVYATVQLKTAITGKWFYTFAPIKTEIIFFIPNWQYTVFVCHLNLSKNNIDLSFVIRCTQLLLPPTLNVAFRFFEPWIAEPFPNEKLYAW